MEYNRLLEEGIMNQNNVYPFNQQVRHQQLIQSRNLKAARRKKALSICVLITFILLLFLNRFGKISAIYVTGNEIISKAEIISLSNLSDKDNYWNLHEEDIKKRIQKNNLIKEVEISKNFPSRVTINVKENSTVAYMIKDNKYYLLLENGTMLDKFTNDKISKSVPVIKQFTRNDEKQLRKLISELNKLPSEIQSIISEINFLPTKNDKFHIYLYAKNGFTVSASITDLSEKMELYPVITKNLDSKQYPVIHLEDSIFANNKL
ncbi:cell division FtsQ family protein [Bacillus pseudomycoides]|nr:cell division FtsQ family protein [Bacillus pseudomycoides]AJI18828.1 cell division FtsQ family protein [Bacillus pseudomycoides]